MSNLVKRVLTTVIGVPAVVSLLILLPQSNHLAFCLVVFLASLIGSLEMGFLLFKDKRWHYVLGSLLPVLQFAELFFKFEASLASIGAALLLIVWCLPEISRGKADDFRSSLDACSRKALLVLYPGFLTTFLIRILALDAFGRSGGWLLLLMILLVFANDVFAYAAGMLLGRGHGGIVAVSPHKSLAGFIGGGIMCIAASVALCMLLFEGIALLPSIALGLAVSITANAGDLLESLFKRSAGVKDSGNVIPGRGGMLDCIDSIIITAPVFYLLLELVA